MALTGSAAGESPDWIVKNWSVDEGFPGSSVNTICQTRDGYLWLGTKDRLVRFDGVRFVSFGPDERGIVPLGGFRREQLWCNDAQGRLLLWKENSFHPVPLPPGEEGPVDAASEDPHGTTWFWMGGNQYAWQNGKWTEIPGTEKIPKGAWFLRGESPGVFWTTHSNQFGFFEHGKFVSLWPPNGVNDGRAESMRPAKGGGLWGITRLPNGEQHLRKISKDGAVLFSEAIPWKGNVWFTDVFVDRQGSLWISSTSHGVLRLRPDCSWEEFNLRRTLGARVVRDIFEDAEGNVWFATDGKGLFRLTRRAFRTYGSADGLTIENIYAVAPSREGGVWIGTHGDQNSGLFRFANGRFTVHFDMGPYAWSLHEDAGGDVWAGNLDVGLYRMRQGEATYVPGAPANVFAMCDDGEGGVWIGGDGLSRVRDGSAKRVEQFPSDPKVSSLVRDTSGTIWIGTRGAGLYAMRQGAFERLGQKEGLPSDDVLCLYAGGQGDLWVGTALGLSRKTDGGFNSIGAMQGLPYRAVSGVAEHDLGNMWFHSPEGIYRVPGTELEDCFSGKTPSVNTVSYGREDGLATRASTFGTQPRVCKDRDGRIWFTTLRGAAVIDPASMPLNPNPPPVVIEEVLVNGRVQRPDGSKPDDASSTIARVGRDGSMLFPPGSIGIEIHYTAGTLVAPEKSRFKYRLSGVHRDWYDADGRRFARFEKLPPGAYRFDVIACNNDGIWNEQGASFAFVVQPHVWETLWFRFAVSAAAIVLIGFLVRGIATRRLRRQLAVAEMEAAVERERSRISQDMHDELGARLTKISILGELARRGTVQSEESWKHIRNLSLMARQTAESLSDLIWTVKPANDSLRSLANRLSQHAHEFLQETDLRCRLEIPDDLPGAPISSEVRRQIVLAVKEALTNAVKHARASEIHAALRIENGHFVVSISDNGRGFSIGPEGEPGAGNGLSNMRDRLHAVGGCCEINSRPGGGTCVEFKAPLSIV